MELPLNHPSACAVSGTILSVQWAGPPLSGMPSCPTEACQPPRPWAPSSRKSLSPRAWPWLHQATLLQCVHLLRAAGPRSPPAPCVPALFSLLMSPPALGAVLPSFLSLQWTLCASFSDSPGLCPEAGATGLADWGRAETQLLSHGTGSSISSGVYSCAHPVFVEVVQKRSSHGPCLLRLSVLQEK